MTIILVNKEAQQIVGVDYYIKWEGISELVESLEKPDDLNRTFVKERDVSFLKSDWRDSQKGAICRKGAEELMPLVPSFQKEVPTLRRLWDEDGSELSIDRYLDDNELCWKRTKRRRRPMKTIRILAEISATGISLNSELMLRTSVVLALGQWLEDYGYEVEVLAGDYSQEFGKASSGYYTPIDSLHNSDLELGLVTVKGVEEDLNADKLAALLSRHEFAFSCFLQAIVKEAPFKLNERWGRVTTVPQRILDALEIDVSVPRRIATLDAAIEWLENVAKRLAI